ncbi:MAG: hypothetical protein RIA62_14360 [Cyclobacteriaceae bacterium]
MKITIPISVLLVLLLAACGGDKPDQINKLKDEVMGLHDEVMPKMGDLRKASKSLIMKAETLDSTSATELKVIAEDIEAANEFMMEWMRQYEPDMEGTEEELLEYYKSQRAGIQEVKERMLNALEQGQKALSE